ncbi:RHS repeat-associated core domain-containing protein [Acrocarpospora corrugata]|uniref:RHS repeat-associated core domain-containing protein n=1 Tax=Acrocarpospora corrugata TaxID=35763 RepID=UPI0014789041|nr:RHS repeat-associated core domain-containing protein [Acrocarpospora corrugata]
MGIAGAVLISGVGVPEGMTRQAAAATRTQEPEPSVQGKAVPHVKPTKGAEDSQPKPVKRDPVWPKADSAEVEVSRSFARVGDLPVRVAGQSGRIRVETLPGEVVRGLGGIGLGVRLSQADPAVGQADLRIELSYAGFKDSFGGNLAGRLRLLRLPACVAAIPRPPDCQARPQEVKAVNDLGSGTLVADIKASSGIITTRVRPGRPAIGAEKTTVTSKSSPSAAVYLLSAGLASADGNFGATDLKPAGTWQAGTSGGAFSYDLPIPEPPSPGGNGPNLSLGYNASSIDGQGDWTNNQSGVVGAGWDLSSGFIERRYRRCAVDYFYDEEGNQIWLAQQVDGGEALCWESPDLNDGDSTTNDLTQSELVLNVGGRSAQIVKDRTSGAYKTVPDLGWKLELLTGAASGQDYWRAQSSEGEVYRLGYTRDSSWQVPYVGNNFGEPCSDRYWADFSPPTCTGVWRWNLDQEIDRNENVIDYSYNREPNNLCFPSCLHEVVYPLTYDRGGFLSQLRWGHNMQVAGSVPTARMTFTTADRGGTDVPGDLRCDTASGCSNSSIAFFSTRKIGSILTESVNPTSSAWDPVNRLDFTHSWVYTRDDFGPYDPVLWLDTVQQTGLAGGTIKLPPVDFDAVMLAGKMVYDDLSEWDDLLSWRMVPRVGAIGNGMGGRIEVQYAQNNPCSGGNGRNGSNYFNDHAGDCYKLDQSIPGNEAWTVYYKQLVSKVTEKDLVTGSPDMVTAYEYIGSPGWASPLAYGDPFYAPALTDWRGYAGVRTIEGSGTDPSQYSVKTRTFLRGMGGTVTDFEGGTVTDARALQGQLLQEQTWQMTGYSPRTYEEERSTRQEYTITVTGNGPGVQDPAFVLPTRERTRERVTGGSWRWTESRTVYNADGLPTRTNDYGDTSTATDNSCSTFTYARNTAGGTWMTNYPSVIERRSGDGCTTGTLVGKNIRLYDGGTDPATNAPSDGNVTETREYVTAATFATTKAAFDNYGRGISQIDPLNKTTTMQYLPAVGWPSGGLKTTNPLGHITTTKASHLTGKAISVVDPNNGVFEIDYDALGRTTTFWGLGEPRSGGTPSATVAYDIPFNGALGQPTGPAKTTILRLLSGSTYVSHTGYEDGHGRDREQQMESPAGGRIVTITAYDSRGLPAVSSNPVHNMAAAGSGLLNPAFTDLPQWAKTVYDGLERPTAVINYHLGSELRRTTTAYPGADRIETTPPVGGKTANVLDAYGQRIKVEEWKDGLTHHDTTYAYDLTGRVTGSTDAKGNVRIFGYDLLGRNTTATDPDSGSSSIGYDAAGRVLFTIDGNGTKISSTYDDLGRRTSQWSGEAVTGTKLTEWVYDTLAKGKLTSATRLVSGNAYVDTVTAYDSYYRPTATKRTIPAVEGALAGDYVFSAAYDRSGNLTQQGMPAAGGLPAEVVSFGYTSVGLPKSLTSDLGGGTTYVNDTLHSPSAQLLERWYGASAQVKRAYTWDDETGWLTRMTTTAKADTASPVTAQDDQFSYNAAGEITRVLDTPGAQSECFSYDGLHRLVGAFTTTGATCATGSDSGGVDPYAQAYAYDAVGNITTLTSSGQAATYTYPTGTRPNGVTAIARPTGNDTYSYNTAGQLVSRNVGGQAGTFEWNDLGELSQVTLGGQATSMVYDAGGERVIRREPGGATTLYLGGMELRLSGGTVTAKRYYAGADGTLVAMRDGGGVTWMLTGLHGSQQIAIDDATGTVSRERYLPFGQRRGADDLPGTDRGWLGKTEDASTGLVYLSARHYDPAIARFISTDPLLDARRPQWGNPYSYAGNNPIGLSDPSGLAVDGCGNGSGRMDCPKSGPSLIPTPSPQPKPKPKPTPKATPSPTPGEDMNAFHQWCEKNGWNNCPRSKSVLNLVYDLFVADFVKCSKGDVGSCFWAFAGVVTAGFGKAAKGVALASKAKYRKGSNLARNGSNGARGVRLAMTMANVQMVANKYGIDLQNVRIIIDKNHRGGYAGSTSSKQVITLRNGAFKNEEELARTLAHERFHVQQLRDGMGYPADYDAGNIWETQAEEFENLWWDNHPLNPKNQRS